MDVEAYSAWYRGYVEAQAQAPPVERTRTPPSQHCVICNAYPALLCSTCLSAAYCTTRCQHIDRPLHKLICKSYTLLPPRPSPSHRLAIHLPDDSTCPLPLWINCITKTYDGQEYELPDVSAIFHQDTATAQGLDAKSLRENVPRKYKLDHTIDLQFRDTFLFDGSRQNTCVKTLLDGNYHFDWRGPLVVMSLPGVVVGPARYQDVTAADFRVIIDYLKCYYGYGFAALPASLLPTAPKPTESKPPE
ncbi:hypothetical protein Dda_8914 [Drechslerella dactyloides]|uniref:MYND-type domain-containing protein n=1 Tax=Drechslerella dactyloides TaxID=74499 RepID=A0AAD6IQ47_DREDA|nr:hypothetical protein Dda_8914 [Drechslerella dactyloides]